MKTCIRPKLSRSFKTAVEPTAEVIQLAQMFGIGLDTEHMVTLYQDLEITIGPGQIVLIVGESGSGKSCCLRDLRYHWSRVGGRVILGDGALPEKPLVNVLQAATLEERCKYLSLAGLAEPNVMIRKPSELSDGQKYRLMVAMALAEAAKDPGIVFMDEFGAFLDRETAKGVSHNMRKAATRDGVGFVLATTHTDLIEDLQPNTLVTMRLRMEPATKERTP